MKRKWLVLIGGIVVALLAYGGSYLVGSSLCRTMADSANPELTWLQHEFHLSDAEFSRISKMHESYLAACAKRCERIDATNAELAKMLAATNAVTPGIEQKLSEAAQLRAECQAAMLQHFYEISRTMPPDQGRRYLDWVISRTLGPQHSTMKSEVPGADHEHGSL